MPHGFDRARKYKNDRKYINHNKEDKGKLYCSGSILTSKDHDRTRFENAKQFDNERESARDFKQDVNT
jgi:hypothetical protein